MGIWQWNTHLIKVNPTKVYEQMGHPVLTWYVGHTVKAGKRVSLEGLMDTVSAMWLAISFMRNMYPITNAALWFCYKRKVTYSNGTFGMSDQTA